LESSAGALLVEWWTFCDVIGKVDGVDVWGYGDIRFYGNPSLLTKASDIH
jgi:hypothetical protein